MTDKLRGVAELEELDRVFSALGHQTRRAILLVLHANGGQMTSGAIASRFDCSWPTTTRHLRVLEEAGLVRAVLHGRERVYELDAARLRSQALGWIDRFGT
ncbi:MAG: helix-turn-helix transcriptional regulator [Catenulispora sp.]|nr:helix-turn-helix transcriptional regulator [Catenulispora sp.]